MDMKFKTFIVLIILSAFSASLFAKPVTYSFSGFGGGLPSSARAGADTATSKKIIIEDDEDTSDDYYDDEPTVKNNSSGKTALIVTGVVIGLVAVAGVIYGTYYFSNQSGECCAEFTDSAIQGCGEGCGEACEQSMEQACSESISSACSSSSSSSSCSSSSSSTSCDTASIGALFENGLQIIPIFIP